MRKNQLLNLLARNRHRGEFRAETGDAGNTIWLYDQIVSSEMEAEWCGGVAADTFVRTLLAMTGPVQLRINSPGGDVFGARSMAQAIREYPDLVTAHVDGYAASAASFITSVADRTVVAPGAMLMIHKAGTIGWGNADDFGAIAALLGKIDGTIAETYASAATKRGKEAADFMVLMAAETWLTGEEAIELGLADEIAAGADKSAATTARARWDMSAYGHAPVAPGATIPPMPEPAAPEADPAPVVHPEASVSAADSQLDRQRRIAALRLKTPA